MHLVKVLVVCQRVESFAVVAALNLREYALNTIKLRAVADILDLFDVNLVVKVFDLILIRVDLKLVHQYS